MRHATVATAAGRVQPPTLYRVPAARCAARSVGLTAVPAREARRRRCFSAAPQCRRCCCCCTASRNVTSPPRQRRGGDDHDAALAVRRKQHVWAPARPAQQAPGILHPCRQHAGLEQPQRRHLGAASAGRLPTLASPPRQLSVRRCQGLGAAVWWVHDFTDALMRPYKPLPEHLQIRF